MLLVCNKQKIYTYLVSIVTVVLLFCLANSLSTDEKVIQTSASNSKKMLPIYNVETNEKKVAFTMNCAW